MRINVLYAVPPTSIKFRDWHDGFTAAMSQIAREHEVAWLNVHPMLKQLPSAAEILDCDFLLVKSNFGWIPDVAYVDAAKTATCLPRVGLMISGSNPPATRDFDRFDVLYYETTWMRPFVQGHPRALHAFGIDTDVMHPTGTERDVDWLMVGRPAVFKHPEVLTSRPGYRMLVGETHGAEETVRALRGAGVEVRDFMTYPELAQVYNRTKTLIMAADLHGGGERAILEARACGCAVDLVSENPKLRTVVEGPIHDHHYYASQLLRGMDEAIAAEPTVAADQRMALLRVWARRRKARALRGKVGRLPKRLVRKLLPR